MKSRNAKSKDTFFIVWKSLMERHRIVAWLWNTLRRLESSLTFLISGSIIVKKDNNHLILWDLLYSTLYRYIRTDKVDSATWKPFLDKFFEKIPDNPITSKITCGLCEPTTSKPTNSLLKWIMHLGLLGRRKLNPD